MRQGIRWKVPKMGRKGRFGSYRAILGEPMGRVMRIEQTDPVSENEQYLRDRLARRMQLDLLAFHQTMLEAKSDRDRARTAGRAAHFFAAITAQIAKQQERLAQHMAYGRMRRWEAEAEVEYMREAGIPMN